LTSKECEGKIEELIKLIDTQYFRIKSLRACLYIKALKASYFVILFSLIIYFILVSIMVSRNTAITISDAINYVMLISSMAAIIFASPGLISLISELEFSCNVNFKTKRFFEMQADKNKETRILIRALVTMKTLQPNISLFKAFEMNPELFSKKRLLELLYKKGK